MVSIRLVDGLPSTTALLRATTTPTAGLATTATVRRGRGLVHRTNRARAEGLRSGNGFRG